MTQSIAIIGASGYTGAELIRLIATHPSFRITALAANSKAGQPLAAVFPHLRHLDLPDLVTWEQIDFDHVDLCFCALPHKTSQEVISQLPRSVKIVDLSADFRLRDPEAYAKWYGNSNYFYMEGWLVFSFGVPRGGNPHSGVMIALDARKMNGEIIE